MSQELFILAAGDDPTGKLIIGVLIGVVWIIAQVAGALKSKPDKRVPPSGQRPPVARPPAKRRPEPILPTQKVGRRGYNGDPRIGGERVPNIGQAPRPNPPVLPPAASPSRPQRSKPQLIPQTLPVPVTSPYAVRPQPTAARPTAAVASPAPRRKGVATLLQPQNIQKAFILSEILRPPVSLRPDSNEAAR